MEQFTTWFTNLMDTVISFTVIQGLAAALLAVLMFALIICVVRDEPLAYIRKPDGRYYKLCPRSGLTEVIDK